MRLAENKTDDQSLDPIFHPGPCYSMKNAYFLFWRRNEGKMFNAKREGWEVIYAIHQQWLSLNHINAAALETKNILQAYIYDSEKKGWSERNMFLATSSTKTQIPGIRVWIQEQKSVIHWMGWDMTSCQTWLIQYVQILKVWKGFDKVVAYLLQYVDKNGSTNSLYVAALCQDRPLKCQKMATTAPGTFNKRIRNISHSPQEYVNMNPGQKDELKSICQRHSMNGRESVKRAIE